MGLFKKLGRALRGSTDADTGLYYYVKLKRGGEIVQLRLEPRYELVPNYDDNGYVTRKTVVGPKSFQRAEVIFRFNTDRRLVDAEVDGGELVGEEEWLAQQQSGEAQSK